MRFLLDTQVLLWALVSPERIPTRVRERLESPEHEVLFSAANIWEIAFKVWVRRMELPIPIEEVIAAAAHSGFEELLVRASHAAATAQLPLHHRDPFDRILVAQALYEPARLLTADRKLARYSDIVEVLARVRSAPSSRFTGAGGESLRAPEILRCPSVGLLGEMSRYRGSRHRYVGGAQGC